MFGVMLLAAPATVPVARFGARRAPSVAKPTGTLTTHIRSARRQVARVVRASIQEPETAAAAATPETLPAVWNEDDIDSIQFASDPDQAAISNKAGAGATMAAPDWLTQLNRLWGGNSEIPVADAKMEDITGLLGGGLFVPLFKWMTESGPVYLLPTGPVTSYVVVSDPDCIKQILFNYGSKYIKGTIAEAGEFLFGLGVALQENEAWKIRRKAVAPSLHRRYIELMVDRCFGPCAERMVDLILAQAAVESRITGLLGGGLFVPLFKWMTESGPVYLLPTGPVTSYVVVSDPDCIKQILFNYGSKYIKGTIAEAGEFLFGLGVALQENEAWKIRRKAVAPSLHRRYIELMVDRCFGPCAERMVDLILAQAAVEPDGAKKRLNMESKFSQTALDIIGISVFNYDFKALTSAAPVIQATYTALKEVETRSMDLLPTWRLPEPFLYAVSPR